MTNAAEANKALILRLYEEAVNQGLYEQVADEITAPDAIMHNALYSGQVGPEVIKSTWRSLHESFSYLRFEIEGIVAENDEVAVRGVTTGLHTGTFRGHAPTGKRISQRAHVFYRIKGGCISEVWPLVDHMGLQAQIQGD
ncbi:putative ester cyclase [Nocardiopsis mwathae]|uniref:Putative ester cyclase n=1 Tax=Nocardiopsis mwathae TaxID=1472723 RepID=A0A7W9YLA4_9ACTN|nr:ester cyclase [Nocardiopsis mwathae]MBB6174265.1 putative ester cyclase [Nocardiopsis mwathae]